MAGDISHFELNQILLANHGAGLTNSNTVSYPKPVRKWIALVTSDPEATADFVAHIDEMKLQALNDIVDSPDDVVPTIRGTIKALKDLRFHVTAAVNEERQRARRPVAAA